MNATETTSDLHYGDRLTHVDTGAPGIVESVSWWNDGRIEVLVRFGGNPRTDDWGPFREVPTYSSAQARDLERIVVDRDHLGEWARA